jgi:hypothetical protein
MSHNVTVTPFHFLLVRLPYTSKLYLSIHIKTHDLCRRQTKQENILHYWKLVLKTYAKQKPSI